MPLSPGRCSLTCCRPSDWIHKQVQNQLPCITVVQCHRIAGCIYFKLPGTSVGEEKRVYLSASPLQSRRRKTAAALRGGEAKYYSSSGEMQPPARARTHAKHSRALPGAALPQPSCLTLSPPGLPTSYPHF